MKEMTSEEIFISIVRRINGYLIIMGAFYFLYFWLQTKVNMFLFLLALSNMGFALLSHKHLIITDRLSAELWRAKTALDDVSKDMREMHPDLPH
jgi:hypothetical protein